MMNLGDSLARIKGYSRRAAASLTVALVVLAQSNVARGENFHVGLQFLDEVFESIYQWGIDQSSQLDFTFTPVTMTDPSSNAVMDGGLKSETEEDVRRAITLATEDAFRAVDTGDPNTTLRIAIHEGAVPTSIEGRRLNLILGEQEFITVLGFSTVGAAFDPVSFPNDADPSMVMLENIDELADVSYDTADSFINAITGTAAHEIGHLFDLTHVTAGTMQPLELMASGNTGLANAERLTVRRFTNMPDSQGPGQTSASKLIDGIGTVNRTDFNMDDTINVFGDATILVANFLRTDALFQEGDANGDHIVNVLGDGVLLVANLPAADSVAGASARYNPVTGEVFFGVAGPMVLGLSSTGANLVGADVDGISTFGGLEDISDASNSISWLDFGGFDFDHASAGRLVAPNTPIGDLTFTYQISGDDPIVGLITLVPEPSSIVLILLGLPALWLVRRRRALVTS